MKALLITGDRSGSGKTSITLALALLLKKRGSVQTFKVGMDYIDPSYLSAVSGRPCRNLDNFALGDRPGPGYLLVRVPGRRLCTGRRGAGPL